MTSATSTRVEPLKARCLMADTGYPAPLDVVRDASRHPSTRAARQNNLTKGG